MIDVNWSIVYRKFARELNSLGDRVSGWAGPCGLEGCDNHTLDGHALANTLWAASLWCRHKAQAYAPASGGKGKADD